MDTHKLNITINLDQEMTQEEVVKLGKNLLVKLCALDEPHNDTNYLEKMAVSLTRVGDRSDANLFMPVGLKHFKHGKASIKDVFNKS